MNVHVAQIKAALAEHDSNSSVKGFTSGVDQIKAAAQKKDASSGADGIYAALKSSFSYVFGYAKTVWSTNNTGKALIIITVIVLFNLLF